jgi:4-amino-4-deoxy-L-arabinose transferase-like glycosyltransferase
MPEVPRSTGAALLAAVALLLTTWSLVVPVFEAPDEPAHWQYARFLHDRWSTGDWSLPHYEAGFEEANSPPLAYAAIAALAAPSELPTMVVTPNVEGGHVSLAPPRTFYNTDRDLGRYRPLRLARFVSVAMSVVTVWLCYLIGRTATGRADTGLLTALVVALLPQFSFRAGQVSNDACMTMWAAAVTLGLVRQLRLGFTWSRGLWTAVALACAYLSKISAIALVVPFAFVLGTERGPLRTRAARFAVLGLALAIVLPWTLRNIALYGDPFASGAMEQAVAHIITKRSLLSTYFLWDFPYILSLSFVGIFGWANVMMPRWIYALYAAGALTALVGLAREWAGRRLDRRLVTTLALTLAATLAIVVHINLSFTQPQGRYLFPALPAVALLVVLGLQGLPALPAQPGAIRPSTAGVVLVAGNLYALAMVVWPAYYPAVAHDLGTGSRTLGVAATAGFAFDPRDGAFVVTGPDPWWLVPIDERAERYGTIELELHASLAPAARQGCVYFSTVSRTMVDTPRRCFVWTADGKSQRVTVSMRDHPGWTGQLTHLRVDVLDDDQPPAPGARVTLERWLLHR